MFRRLVALLLFFLPELLLLSAFSFWGASLNNYFVQFLNVANPAFLLLIMLCLTMKLIRSDLSTKQNVIEGQEQRINLTTSFFVLFIAIGVASEVDTPVNTQAPMFGGLNVYLFFKGISGLAASWLIGDLMLWLKHKFLG